MSNEQLTIGNDQLPKGYKQTEIGVIPEDWKLVCIGELEAFVTSGSRGWARYYSKFGAPFIRITNLRRESIYLDFSDLKIVDLPEGVSEGKRTKLYNGDLLISITADIGIIGYVDDSVSKPAYINQHISLVRFDLRKSDSKFIAYFLASESVQRLFRGATDQGAKAGLNLDTIRSLKFAFPPLCEQRSIAQALSDVDRLIAALEKAIAKKRAIKTATMQQLLTGKIRLPGFGEGKGYKQTELGFIPEDWKVRPLSSIVNFTNGKAHENDIKESGRYIVVNSKFISSEAEVKKYSDRCHCPTRKENILMVMSDVPNGRAIAKCFLVDKDDAYTVNQRICSLEVTGENPRFVFYQLDRNPFYLQFDDGVKQTNLRRDEVLACLLPMPALEEQQEIATVLSDMDTEIAALETHLTKTQSIKQGMMQELLTGRTRLV